MRESASTTAETVRGPHRFAIVLSCCIVFLISAGALVTSLQAGLSVPDWPLSYGTLNPPRWWEIENVRAEHGHRLIAGTVALMTMVLSVWLHRRESRRWVKRLSLVAVGTVLAQALLGGLTVLFFLPTPISVSHAGLAQLFFCLIVTLAMVTSAAWPRDGGPLRRSFAVPLAPVTTLAVYVQILLGAVMRHSGAGLAIPDFPWVFGGLVPSDWSFPVAIHYAHRLGALTVTVLVASTVVQAVRRAWDSPGVWIPASLLVVLVATQVTLGAWVIWSEKGVAVNTLHVGVGATILATSLILTLNSWRLGGGRTPVASGLPDAGEGVAA